MDRVETCAVVIEGSKDVMFDRLAGTEARLIKDMEAHPEKRMYLKEKTRELFLPVENLYSFLCSQNGASCVNRYGPQGRSDAAVRRELAENVLSFVDIRATKSKNEEEISFLVNGKPVVFDGWTEGKTSAKGKIYQKFAAPRVKKNGLLIPMAKTRPVLRKPWSLAFTVDVRPNAANITGAMIEGWLRLGGPCLGLGTFRPRYGTFTVAEFKKG